MNIIFKYYSYKSFRKELIIIDFRELLYKKDVK